MDKKIKTIKLTLMKKEGESSLEKGKNNYIIKSSANLNIQKIFNEYVHVDNNDNYDEVLNLISLVYEDLLKESINKDFDFVGIFITLEDDSIIENSISLLLLENIRKYGTEDLVPIKEFTKMTIQ